MKISCKILFFLFLYLAPISIYADTLKQSISDIYANPINKILPKEWRLPDAKDNSRVWHKIWNQRADPTKLDEDFNGDGCIDKALITLSENRENNLKWRLFIIMCTDKNPQLFDLKNYSRDTDPYQVLLSYIAPGYIAGSLLKRRKVLHLKHQDRIF